MTVDQALARIMELHKIGPGEDILRKELRKILNYVRAAGYREGTDDERHES